MTGCLLPSGRLTLLGLVESTLSDLPIVKALVVKRLLQPVIRPLIGVVAL
jgi:hypothetical protein